jgi:hypothetical protein
MSLVSGNSGGATNTLSLAGGAAPINELPNLLKRWMALQEEMASLKADIHQRTTQSKALKDMILRIMETNNVVKLNVSKGAILHKTREVTEKISSNFMLKHCKTFFGGDEERAKALIDYLEENRTTITKHDLKLQLPKSSAAEEN